MSRNSFDRSQTLESEPKSSNDMGKVSMAFRHIFSSSSGALFFTAEAMAIKKAYKYLGGRNLRHTHD
eukprot:10001831-Alexandrium_andersonii.AAC.1